MQGLSGRMSRARGVARSSGEQGRGFGFCPEFRSTGRIGIFLKKISVVWAGGFLVFEPNFHLGRARVRWAGLLSIFGLAAALVVLTSCGSASTTVSPTITVSCVPTDVTVLGTSQCTATVLNLSSTLVNWSVTG